MIPVLLICMFTLLILGFPMFMSLLVAALASVFLLSDRYYDLITAAHQRHFLICIVSSANVYLFCRYYVCRSDF